MFAIRWIVATSSKTHTTPSCRGLASAKRIGWRPFPVTQSYGRNLFDGGPCKCCSPPWPVRSNG